MGGSTVLGFEGFGVWGEVIFGFEVEGFKVCFLWHCFLQVTTKQICFCSGTLLRNLKQATIILVSGALGFMNHNMNMKGLGFDVQVTILWAFSK